MKGANLSGSAYIPWTNKYPEGVRLNSFNVGQSTQSAPVISNGTIYLGGESAVFAIDAETGKTIWEIDKTGPVHGTLAIANDTLFVPLRNKEILALDASSGNRRWSFKAESPFVGSPSINKGIVYSSTQKGVLHALDANTGNPIWDMAAGDAITSAVALNGDKIAIGISTGGLFIKNARTGDNRSRVRIGGLINHPPTVGGESVYVLSNGKVLSFDVDSRELPWSYPLRLVWAQLWLWQLPVPNPPAPTGFQWHATPEEDGAKFITSPAATSDNIYLGSNNSFMYSLSAADGEIIWKFKAPFTPVRRPTAIGERLYFGTSNGTVHSIDRNNGQEEWALELGSPLSAPLTFASGFLYARTEDGKLHKIR